MNKIAAIQMQVGAHVEENLALAADLIQQAAEQGAVLCVLPEAFTFRGKHDSEILTQVEQPGSGSVQDFLMQQARQHQMWLVAGTIPLTAQADNKRRSACLLIDDQGEIKARYDKIHLFDVMVASDESYHESQYTEPGDQVVVADTPVGRIGLSVCYDVRFPELFRALLAKGAEILTVPAAFTIPTGQAHWEVLLRARAIENLCYVIAPAQVGGYANVHPTYGHSMLIDPWGKVLQQLPAGNGVLLTTIDRTHLHSIREQFPSINHRLPLQYPG